MPGSATDITGAQARAARALLGWSPAQAAEAARLRPETVERFEADGFAGASADAVERIRCALEEAGVAFIFANGGGVGVRLRQGPRSEGIDVSDLNASNDE